MQTVVFLLALVASSYADDHDHFSCLAGQATYDDYMIYFDGLRETKCNMEQGETACWSQVMEITFNGPNMTFNGHIVSAGCMNPEFESMYDTGLQAAQEFNMGSNVVIHSYDFNSCNDTDNCNEDVRPAGSNETIKCYSGVTVHENDHDSTIFTSMKIENCRVFETCQSVTVTQEEGPHTLMYHFASCGDPFKTIYDGLNVLPITPSTDDPLLRQQDCMNLGCIENVLGLCICPTSVNVADFATFVSIQDEECFGDLCNNQFVEEAFDDEYFSCLVGTATYNNENDEIWFDGLRERKCMGEGETACYTTTSQISFFHEGQTMEATVVAAGCLNPMLESYYDAGLQAAQEFNQGLNFTINSYDFEACNDSANCNEHFRPAGSEETIKCYSGVMVQEEGQEIFSSFEIDSCRVHYTCQKVTVTQQEGMSTRTYHYASCGDPYKTIYDGQNVLPVTPSSDDPMMRQQDCMNRGCVENVMGLCLCPTSVNVGDFGMVLNLVDEECYGDLCNNRTNKAPGACDYNPCSNMGSCVEEMDGRYTCYCYDGTTGQSCSGSGMMEGMWCMTGERVSMKINVEGNDMWYNIANNAAFSKCPSDYGMHCVHYSVQGQAHSGGAARLDFGECVYDYEPVDCSPYSDSAGTTGFMAVDNCETNKCNGSRCNDFGDYIEGQFVSLPACRGIPTDGALGMFDFRVLPNCSISEIMNGVEQCVSQFANRFPFYEDPNQCQSEVDGMIQCMANLVSTCLSTNCPTLLDSIPGLRSEYHVARFFASQINSVESVIDMIFMLIPFSSMEEQQAIRGMIPDIRQFLCMDPNNLGNDIGAMITDLISNQLMPLIGGSLNLRDIMGPQLADQFFCQDNIIERVLGQVTTMIPNLIASQSETDACNAFVGLANNMISTVGTSCDFGRVDDFITYLIGGPIPGFPMEVFGVLGVLGPMITQFRIPECYDEPSYGPCDSNPCGYQGSCVPQGDYDYTCYCMNGMMGHSCDDGSMNPCDSNPCNYQGSCVRHTEYTYTCYCNDGTSGSSCGGTDQPGMDDDFNCQQYYGGESQCQMRKAWLCDYAQWRWTTLTVWLGEFHQFAQNNGYDTSMMDMPTCNSHNAEMHCRNMEMRRCRYNEQMACNECYCADHEYTDLQGLMNHWRNDYRAWSMFFHKYREMMNNGGHHTGSNDTC